NVNEHGVIVHKFCVTYSNRRLAILWNNTRIGCGRIKRDQPDNSKGTSGYGKGPVPNKGSWPEPPRLYRFSTGCPGWMKRKRPPTEAARRCFLGRTPSVRFRDIFNVPRSDGDSCKPTSDSTHFPCPAERKSGPDRSCTWIDFPLRTVPRHKPSP